jgi:hypothetical protein
MVQPRWCCRRPGCCSVSRPSFRGHVRIRSRTTVCWVATRDFVPASCLRRRRSRRSGAACAPSVPPHSATRRSGRSVGYRGPSYFSVRLVSRACAVTAAPGCGFTPSSSGRRPRLGLSRPFSPRSWARGRRRAGLLPHDGLASNDGEVGHPCASTRRTALLGAVFSLFPLKMKRLATVVSPRLMHEEDRRQSHTLHMALGIPCVLMLRYVRSAGGWQGVRYFPWSYLETRDRRIARAPTSQRHRNSSNG